MDNKWVMRPQPEEHVVAQLRSALNDLPEPLARILAMRGIDSYDQAKLFFRPELEHLHDPFLMTDMDRAVERVVRAIQSSERVLVYGDYDVDGATATAVMVSFLRSHGIDAVYFIPHRIRDGYGLQQIGIDYAANANASLIIALDCGITAHEAAAYAKARGLDLIICDHHTADDTVPDAVAVLNPKRPDCDYPFAGLSGCGVGFKLIQGVIEKLGLPKEDAVHYLDLVALSIASDIVPIVGENRVMMRVGLKQIHENPRLGLRMLATESGLDLSTCDTGNIVFGIGPRINAAGRLSDARHAVELLLTSDESKAQQLAAELNEINLERRQIDTETLQRALEIARSRPEEAGTNALVIHDPSWHVGVIGIVASRLVEHYYRPVVMLATVDGEAKGSARSIKGFNIYDALKDSADLMTRFGGHEYAAGLTLPEANIPLLRERLNAYASRHLTDDILSPEIEIDSALHLSDLTDRFWAVLKQFGPFGPENRRPVFYGNDLIVVGYPSVVGSGHLKFRVKQADGLPGPGLDVIGFNMHEHLPTVRSNSSTQDRIEMVFTVDENTWNNRRSLQLKLKDVRRQNGNPLVPRAQS